MKKEIAEKIGLSYNEELFFLTPDRKLEEYLYVNGIYAIGMIKDETNWTYWAYNRTEELQQALDGYRKYLSDRRKILDSYKKGKKEMTSA